MDYLNENLSFLDKKKQKLKKKKKKKDLDYYDEFDRKSKIFKNIDEEYLKPVKFISGGFLNEKNKLIKESNLNYYSSENESDDYEEYDVFKHFTFDFNFEVKIEKNDFVKDNLKKYNLIELKENDKNFEKYGLGFKILKKMGYEDGIGNKIKTNIAPIEIKKKNIKIIEEKPNENENYDDIEETYLDGAFDSVFNENIDINQLWKKKTNGKYYWNFNKRKKELNIDLKYDISILSSNHFTDDNNVYEFTENNNIHILQKVKNSLSKHIENIRVYYFDVIKKKRETENKLKNYKNCVNENDIYKIHLLILKNILTYKYLLNLHTLLSYPFLFNNLTYNQYLFNNKNYKIKVNELDDFKNINIDNEKNFQESNIYENKEKEKLINTDNCFAINEYNQEDINEHKDQLNDLYIDNFEETLGNFLIEKYKLLCKNGYFKESHKKTHDFSDYNDTYKMIANLKEVYNLIDAQNVEVKKINDELFLRDLYTFLFFIYDNSEFLYLNIYVSNFFLEFLRVYFYNNQEKIKIKKTNYNELHNNANNHKQAKKKTSKNFLCSSDSKDNIANENKENENELNCRLNKNVEIQKQYEQNMCYNNSSNSSSSNDNNTGRYNEEEVNYLIHLKKIILMGTDEDNKNEYNRVENEFDNIIYYNLIYFKFHNENYNELFNYIKNFKEAFNKNYYKQILNNFIKKRIMVEIKNKENEELNYDTLSDIENKLYILFDINKQFDISSYINNYYTDFIFIYLQKYNISENYIKLIKCSTRNNIYRKEIFENITKRIINYLKDINFTDDKFLENLCKVLILYNCIDNNIIYFIFKVYFFYNFSKYVCNYLRDINFLYGKKDEAKENVNKSKMLNNQNITEGQKKEILTIKKKEIYEKFKKVKSILENNIMKDETIKSIMFNILNVVKTYVIQDKIITFSVEKVLNFDKSKIFSDDNLNYYFLYKDIKIPIPLYAVTQKSNIYEINYKNNIKNIDFKEDSDKNYKFSKKKYINIMSKLENDIKQFKNKQQDNENMNVKNYLEKYCLENNILFLQKSDRKVNGNSVYSINNISIYINNNIIYIYQDYEWKPILLSDLLKKHL